MTTKPYDVNAIRARFPSLANALKLPQTHAVVFRPTRMAADARLNLAHIRMGDGGVKPGNRRGVMLVVYSSEADQNGNHSIYAQDVHFFSSTLSTLDLCIG